LTFGDDVQNDAALGRVDYPSMMKLKIECAGESAVAKRGMQIGEGQKGEGKAT